MTKETGPARGCGVPAWIALVCVLTAVIAGPAVSSASPSAGRGAGPVARGMVVSDSRLASEAGAEVLREGGNAVDAIVTAAFTLAVTFPWAGNLGGGGFAVVHPAEGADFTLDFRETAPAAARRIHRRRSAPTARSRGRRR